ncbi:hypothetical protein CHH69_18265, partial [Terribacillus saccharophilus]
LYIFLGGFNLKKSYVVSLSLATLLATSTLFGNSVLAEESDSVSSLSKEQQEDIKKGQEIFQNYDVGDTLSEEDIKFLQENARTNNNTTEKGQMRAAATINKVKVFGSARTSDRNVEADVSGNINEDISLTGSNHLYGDIKGYTVKGNVSQVKVTFDYSGYGLNFENKFNLVSKWSQNTGWVKGKSANLHVS